MRKLFSLAASLPVREWFLSTQTKFVRRSAAVFVAILCTTPVASAVPLGTVYTTRPSISGPGLFDNLEVKFTVAGNRALDSATYSAVASPVFASSSNTFADPATFGGFGKAQTNFLSATAAPGAAVTVKLSGNRYRNAFSGFNYNPLISGAFTSRWYPNSIQTRTFPGIVIGTSGLSPCGFRWVYINSEWVLVDPCPVPVTTMTVTFGIQREPDPDDDGEQLMTARGYRLDTTAQAAIAAHFGAAEFQIDMIRTLGPELLTMGFAGQISAMEFGTETVTVGESFARDFGAIPTDPNELVLLQTITRFTNPLPNQSADPIEYWSAVLGSEMVVPEPSTAVVFGTAFIACWGRRRSATSR